MGDTDLAPPKIVATITSGANTSNPTIVLNSLGTFNIVATVSSSQNYIGTTLTSLPIRVWPDIPDIQFSPIVTDKSPYTYEKKSYKYTESAASITNNTGQKLNYSIVTADSTTNSLKPSTVATIDSTGYFLTTVSCGATGTSTFRICATVDISGNFGPNVALSDILTIVKATPTILQYPQITLPAGVTASALVYGQTYTIIPDPSQISIITSNTDTNPSPTIIYSIIGTNNPVATIYGTTVQIVGIGQFQIAISVSSTINYNQIFQSPSLTIYETIQAVPTITSFPTIPKILGYGSSYVIPPTIITDNTDIPGPLITYTSSDTNVTTISGNTITVTGVTGLVNGIGTGNYQILVTIHATNNFSEMTYTYPSLTTYYQTIWATPDITFSKKAFVTSSMYGSTYNFVAPNFSNYDPSSQTLTYSIVNSVPGPGVASGTSVATLVYKSGVTNPSVVINSVGTFQIQASCLASANAFYSPQIATSDPITISKEIPNIVFNTSNFKSIYTFQPTPYPLTNPIASITNNKVQSQSLTYSIVEPDGDTISNIASISSNANGRSLTTNRTGSFKILATATATANGDYGPNSAPSETITIIPATPTITKFPTLPSQLIYGNTYPIPYTNTPPYTITTSNTYIPGPTITYSSSNTAVATISGSVNYSSISNSAISSINGTSITIVGVGSFQIIVTIGNTTNYNQATYTYPSPTTYYNSIHATPTITFPSNFGSTWLINGIYNLTSTVTTNAGPGYPITNSVTYSIINASISNIATISTTGSQITIKDVGSFQIQASLAATQKFTAAVPVISNTITIIDSNVSILSNNFSNFVYGGGQYPLQVITNNTDTNPPPIITYTIVPQSGSTGNGTISGNLLTITAAGGAYIYVNITGTQNFNAANIPVYVNIAQATQTIVLNSAWISSNMYSIIGSQFGCSNLVLPSQSNNPSPSYSYTVVMTSTIGGNYYPSYFAYGNVATIDSNYNITCVSPGGFTINITAAATTNFSQTTVSTSTIYVSIVPEVIIFNNPQTFPPSPYLGGEVGMAINIPNYTYPFGFQNYSALTITNSNNGASFTLNAQTTPTFNVPTLGNVNNVMNKYIVFFQPATAGSFSQALTPSQATGYIEYVGINSIANGIASGQQLVFTFSGNTSTSVAVGAAAGPDPLIINWNPGSLNITPGLVYGAYYNLNPKAFSFVLSVPNGTGVTISTLNSGGITGYYIAPWAGYNTSSITGGIVSYIGTQNLPYYSYVTQAWGVWDYDSTTNTYPPTISQTINGTTYYYYVGMPQMSVPLPFTNYYQLYE